MTDPYWTSNCGRCEVYQGDALAVLRGLPDGLARCCVTSPPYWGLRDYGTATWDGGDDGCKHRVGGQVQDNKAHGAIVAGVRPGVDAFRCLDCGARRIDAQLGLESTPGEYVARMVEVFREVRRVLADDGTLWLNIGDSYAAKPASSNGYNDGRANREERTSGGVPDGLKPKDLVGIPWMLAFALRADGWYLRQDIIWHKPNPMPESVCDRCTKAHEYLFLLSKRGRYYYDAEAVAEPDKGTDHRRNIIVPPDRAGNGHAPVDSGIRKPEGRNGEGRNRRSVWTVATAPYPEAHFATYPPALITPCILAGSAPGDTVLDPFTGSGTTGAVAAKHGRRFVGVELNPDYIALAAKRISGEANHLFAEVDP